MRCLARPGISLRRSWKKQPYASTLPPSSYLFYFIFSTSVCVVLVSTYQIHLWPAELGTLLVCVTEGDVESREAWNVVLREVDGVGRRRKD